MTGIRQRRLPYRLFTILLTLDVLALLAEKMAAIQSSGIGLAFYVSLVKQLWMWVGLGLGPLQLWVWTKILARTELSLAYPISSLSYPLTMIAAQWTFQEHLPLPVWWGALLITVGVAIVGRGAGDREAFHAPGSF